MANENPLLDTRQYAVEFKDGRSESLSANQIAQNLYSQLDEEGNSYLLLEDIIDHRSNSSAIEKSDAFVKI